MGGMLILSLLAALAGGLLADRKGRSAPVWAVICFLFPLSLVVLAFLPHVRRIRTTCPGCGGALPEGRTTCPGCGYARPIELVECPHCGTMVPAGPHCAQCGRVL